jgi:hypothetical protein
MKGKIDKDIITIISGVVGIISISAIGIFSLMKKKENNINVQDKNNIDNTTNTLNNIENNKIYIEPEYFDKFYKILFEESSLDKDVYKRKLSKKTVKIFCRIAKLSGIKLTDKIDKKTFDELYSKLVEYQICNIQKSK